MPSAPFLPAFVTAALLLDAAPPPPLPGLIPIVETVPVTPFSPLPPAPKNDAPPEPPSALRGELKPDELPPPCPLAATTLAPVGAALFGPVVENPAGVPAAPAAAPTPPRTDK